MATGCHVMSDLLTIREKGVLYSLLKPQCKLIKTTVAQVLVAKEIQGRPPGWSCVGCGALCLMEDESMDSCFLRLYCVKRAQLLWEQELYIPFKYTATKTYFHTFSADDHQAGLNFANGTEAEEFHLAVEAAQRNQEKITRMIEIANVEKEDASTSNPPDSGIKPLDHSDREQHFPMDAPSSTVTPATRSDLDPTMKRLLIQARLTEEDLRDKDIAEAVDCIINQFGGLKAVQRELRSKGQASQTLPRSAGASSSLGLKKGPSPPVPIKYSTTFKRTPWGTDDQSEMGPWVPAPPPPTAPVVPERLRKSESFKHASSSTAEDRGELILTALRAVRQKQLLQKTSADGSQMEPDTDSDQHL